MLALLLVALGVGEAPVQIKEPARVGQIVIVGNEVTPQGLIIDRIPLFPGQMFTAADLRAAQQRLQWLTLLGVEPSVSVAQEDGTAFKDITVNVKETPLTYLLVGVPNFVLAVLNVVAKEDEPKGGGPRLPRP
jgi:outer membrane protein assembly factor BamA